MSTKQEKLAAFFAKKDKKIQKMGYTTVNQIAAQKLQKIKEMKSGAVKPVAPSTSPTPQADDQDSEWKGDDYIRPMDDFERLNEFLQKIEENQQLNLKSKNGDNESEKKDSVSPDKDKVEQKSKSPSPKPTVIKVIVPDPNAKKKPAPYRPGNMAKLMAAKKEDVFSINDQDYPTLS